jgi:uncharacterized protein (DUF1501 family)
MSIYSRRDFLRNTLRSVTALGACGALSKFGEINALAAGASGYQALVCVYLNGGNNGHNTVVPITTAQQNYSVYQAARQSLAVPQASLLPIAVGSDTYGLHPSIPELQQLYNSGHAAILANVGMLVTPMNRTAFNAPNAIVPASLFSHSDQTGQWQTAIPTGLGNTGWGGRIADQLAPLNAGATFPTVTSIQGCDLFCLGNATLPATVPASGPVQLTGALGSPARTQAIQQLLTFDNGLQLVQAANGILSRGNNEANALASLISTVTIKTPFPAGNPLADQLLMAAKLIGLRNQLGLSRQIFFCMLDGFDTHSDELNTQQLLLQQTSQAISAFFKATQELLVDQQVTTFTASEFGRTLTPNGSAGTDHAWGNHHFIVGSAVKGGTMYGSFPSLTPGSQNDTNSRGTLIPTTAVDQYAATMAQWFGVAAGANMAQVFPNLSNFGTPNLGFLG